MADNAEIPQEAQQVPKETEAPPAAPAPARLQLPAFSWNVSTEIDFSVPTDYSTLKEKTAIITGGASGIGEGVTRALAGKGVYVVFTDIQKENGERIEKEITEAGHKAKFLVCDVGDWDAQVAVFKAAIEFSPHKKIDIVMANAGISGVEPFFPWRDYEPTLEDECKKPNLSVIDINLNAVLYTMRLAIHYFSIKSDSPIQGRGSMIVVSSLGGYGDMMYSQLYGTSKYGVRGLFRSLRNAVPKDKMRINLIAPSWVKTGMTQRAIPFLEQAGAEFATMETVQEAVLRLSADDSINGRAVTITGRGNFDLKDDRSGNDAGEMIKKLSDEKAID